MSLNGLDAEPVLEALQAANTEPGGWFLLEYKERDEVGLLARGNGGVPDLRQAIAEYTESKPLYGFVKYRRRTVLLKYVPEGTSRLLQARVAVHFQAVAEKFSPHDTVFPITSSTDLKESALSAACSLHAASNSTSSTNSSMRKRRLGEIAEDEDENRKSRQSEPGKPLPPLPPDGPSNFGEIVTQSGGTPTGEDTQRAIRDALQAATLEPARSSRASLERSSTTKTLPVGHSRPGSSVTNFTHGLVSRDSEDRRISTSSLRPTTQELYNQYGLSTKPKVKLGPRPSLDIGGRPHTSGAAQRQFEPRPVSTLPMGLRVAQRKTATSDKGQPKSPTPSTLSLRSNTAPLQDSLVPPIPLFTPTRPTTSPSSVKSSAASIHSVMSKSPSISPEKLRLRKALELRKAQMSAAKIAASKVEAIPSEQSAEPVKSPCTTEDVATKEPPQETKETLASSAENVEDAHSEAPGAEATGSSPVTVTNSLEPPSTNASSLSDSHEDQAAISHSENLLTESVRPVSKQRDTGNDLEEIQGPEGALITDDTLGENQSTEEVSKPRSGPEEIQNTKETSKVPDGPERSQGSAVTTDVVNESEEVEDTEQVATSVIEPDDQESAQHEIQESQGDITMKQPDLDPSATPLTQAEAEAPAAEEHSPSTPGTTAEGQIIDGSELEGADDSADFLNHPSAMEYAAVQSSLLAGYDSSPLRRTEDHDASKTLDGAVLNTLKATLFPEKSVIPITERQDGGSGLLDIDQRRRTRYSSGSESSTGSAKRASTDLEQAYRKKRRRGNVEPIRTDISPDDSDENLLSDDSLMKELRAATVQEAKPVAVAKSPPGTSYAGASSRRPSAPWMTSRSVSSSVFGGADNGQDNGNEVGRSVSGPMMAMKANGQSPIAMIKKINVSSGISQRIKQLELLSSQTTSPTSPPVSSAPSPNAGVNRKKSLRHAITTSDSDHAAAIKNNPRLPSPVPSLDQFQRSQSKDEHPSRRESVSVKARIIRDPKKSFPEQPKHPIDPNDPLPLELHESPLTITHHPATSSARPLPLASSSSTENARQPSPTKRNHDSAQNSKRISNTSRTSTSSIGKGEAPSRNSLSSEEKKDAKKESTKNRIFRRMSSISSASRKSLVHAISPTVKEEESGGLGDELPEEDPRRKSIDVGEVNVQFPDSLLWKRRFLHLDSQGYINLTQPQAAPASNKAYLEHSSKRYHISDFNPPFAPDQDRQELPNSVLLDFRDGSTLQCACEDGAGQGRVLGALREGYVAWT